MDEAFFNQSHITSIVIPNSVNYIGSSAFEGCSSLKSIVLPSNIEELKIFTFKNCSSLKSVVLPKKITRIWSYAFEGCTSLETIELPESLKRIDGFQDCSALKAITIPMVDEIGVTTFMGCTSLEVIYFTYPHKNYDPLDTYTRIKEWMSSRYPTVMMIFGAPKGHFFGPLEIIVESTCTTDGQVKFVCSDCGLTETQTIKGEHRIETLAGKEATCMEDGLTEGQHCTVCQEVFTPQEIIPKSLGAHTDVVYGYCKGCKGQLTTTKGLGYQTASYSDYPGTVYAVYVDSELNLENHIYIPEVYNGKTVTAIRKGAFHRTSIRSIFIPATVELIGYDAFYDCNALEVVSITDLKAWCNITFGTLGSANPLEFAEKLYVNGEHVTNVTIPAGITKINDLAFSCFSGIHSVSIPEGVKSIGIQSFVKCVNLYSVSLPNSLRSIGHSAFSGCTKLSSITIPRNVSYIGITAFYGCSSLKNIYFEGTKAEWKAIDKGSDWAPKNVKYTIHCSDGDI